MRPVLQRQSDRGAQAVRLVDRQDHLQGCPAVLEAAEGTAVVLNALH